MFVLIEFELVFSLSVDEFCKVDAEFGVVVIELEDDEDFELLLFVFEFVVFWFIFVVGIDVVVVIFDAFVVVVVDVVVKEVVTTVVGSTHWPDEDKTFPTGHFEHWEYKSHSSQPAIRLTDVFFLKKNAFWKKIN